MKKIAIFLFMLLALTSCFKDTDEGKKLTETGAISSSKTSNSSGTTLSNSGNLNTKMEIKNCKLADCGVKNKDLMTFLEKKGIKELKQRGGQLYYTFKDIEDIKKMSETEKKDYENNVRYNLLLVFENNPNLDNGSFYDIESNLNYAFDKTFKVVKSFERPKLGDDVSNLINTIRLVSVCGTPDFKDLDSCINTKAIALMESKNWEQFKVENKIEDNIKNIKDDNQTKGMVLKNLSEKIQAIQSQNPPKEHTEDVGKSLFEIIK